MINDPYESFAERYDWMYQRDPARVEFFRQLFDNYSVSDLLDCACGTGTGLIMFHSLDCNEEEEVRRALQSMKAVLRPSGIIENSALRVFLAR
jgi:hypothetical protein